jgi:autotransporter-associated beta strand protein
MGLATRLEAAIFRAETMPRLATHIPEILLGVSFAFGLAVTRLDAAPPGKGWALAWSDEFSGTTVDTSKWNVGTGARRDATNTASAVSVAGGMLSVKTYTEGGKHYTGWLGSNGKFENAFGYWEARIRFNSSAGMWSAFWLQPNGINNVGDPAGNGTEIDIVEHRRQDSGGADMRNKSAMNVHWDGYGASHKSVGSTVNNPGVDTSSLQGNFHTYGLLWEPGKYTFYIDGAEVWSTTAAISQVRQWIYLTSEVDNGAWAGNIPSGGYGDRNATTTKFDVDWVRFHQRDEQVINPGFTHRNGPWSTSGSASWSSTGGRNSGPGVRLNPSTTTASAYEQSVHGLLPNTEYRLLGWGSVGSRTWPDIRFGVKNHGNPEVWQSIWSSGFTQAQLPFATGQSNNSARVYARVPTQWGDCFADDIEIRRDSQINNSGFESGETWPWSVYGDAFVHDWSTYVRSGSNALRFNGSANSRGAEQTVYGLQPNTTYTLSCWVRTGGQPVRLGVKNHGLAESSSTFTGTGNTWQRGSHSFTTGAAANSATIYAFIPAGSNVGAADLDDFTLSNTLPSPWTGTDIGATGRNGESFARGSKIVLRGSGANVFDAADSFHFVHQSISGDFALSAKLDSFEADSPLAKAGIMLRADTTANSAHAMVHWLPQGQVEFIWRNTAGAAASYVWAPTATTWPPRLRLHRAGNLVTASYSTDGTTWTQVGAPQAIALPETVLGGPAVCAHDSGNTGVATFSNISSNGDRDGDGILDDSETNTGIFVSANDTGTDPDNPDTDGDGFLDGSELSNGTNPFVPNTEMIWQTGAAPGGTGTWNTSSNNWRIGSTATAWTPGKTALFGGTAGTVTVAPGITGITGMIFNTAGYILDGTGPLNLPQESFIANNITGSTVIAAPLAGSSALAIGGGGTLQLRADNRGFTGSLIVDGNTQLRPYNDSTKTLTGHETGGTDTTVEIRAGSQIRWFNPAANATYVSNFHIAGSGIAGGNPGVLNLDTSVARTLTLGGSITLDANATIATQNQGSFILAGPIEGPHTLTINQNAAASTISGPLSPAGLGKTGAGTLVLSSLNLTAASITCSAGTLDFNPAADATFPGILSGTGAITKSGTYTLTLSGANTFGTAGGTYTFGTGTANAGAIRLGHPQALGNHSKIRLNSGQSGVSRLELSGGHVFPLSVDTVGRNTAAGQVALRNTDGGNTLHGNLTIVDLGGAYHFEALAGSSLTITGNLTNTLNAQTARDVRFTGDGDITLQGAIADSATATPTRLTVTKEGAGTLRLTGASTHTNPTTVNSGTLRIDGTFSSSTVNVAAGGTLAGTGAIPAAIIAGKLTQTIGDAPLDIAGSLALENATLELTGSASAPVHILVNRGSITGNFVKVTGVPTGYTLDTSHNGNSIALVRNATADYEIWAAANGLDPFTNGAPNLDHDSDGLANGVEFVLGLNPASGDLTHPNLPQARVAGSDLIFSFTRSKAAAANGFVSSVEWSSSLAPPSWTTATPGQISISDHGLSETVTAIIPIPAGTQKLFARIRVASP